MTITVEDGTGRADAEGYISVVEFKAFCTKRGYDIEAFETPDMETAIRRATDYLDSNYRFKGNRSKGSQSLEFPRINLVDWSGYAVTGVPLRVKNACSELTFIALGEALYQNQDRGGKTRSESIGNISVTYLDDAPTGKVWQLAHNFLKPYVRDPKYIGVPSFGGATSGDFSRGMQDNPVAADPTLNP